MVVSSESNKVTARFERTRLLVVGSALGALATMIFMHRDTAVPPATPKGDYSVGVNCADRSAGVSSAQSGNTVSFTCFNADGQQVAVTALTNLLTNHNPNLPGYNDIVDFSAPAPGDTMTFALDPNCGLDPASVTVWETLQRASNQPNSAIVGLASTGCARNSNMTNDIVSVHN